MSNQNSLAQALARTYTLDDRDPWTHVQEYWQVVEYCARHPTKGSAAVAAAIDLPRSRIRLWVDGDGMPDAARAIHVADERGWLADDWTTPAKAGLNVLVAAVFSGGSIEARNYRPQFTFDDERTRETLETGLDCVGVDHRVIHTDADTRATELAPTEHASRLGRMLAALGAPVGEKNTTANVSLPSYLASAPYATRLDFARMYVQNRSTDRPDRPTTPLQLQESRSLRFKNELASFLREVVGDDEAITGGGTERGPLFLSERAVATLDSSPTFGSVTNNNN